MKIDANAATAAASRAAAGTIRAARSLLQVWKASYFATRSVQPMSYRYTMSHSFGNTARVRSSLDVNRRRLTHDGRRLVVINMLRRRARRILEAFGPRLAILVDVL